MEINQSKWLCVATCAVALTATNPPAFAQQPSQTTQAATCSPAQAKALEDMSYAIALNAATWGSPVVIMYALRYNDAVGPNAKAAPNNIWRMENTSTPELAEKAGYVLQSQRDLWLRIFGPASRTGHSVFA